jgi:hypothetical protein
MANVASSGMRTAPGATLYNISDVIFGSSMSCMPLYKEAASTAVVATPARQSAPGQLRARPGSVKACATLES